MGEAFDGPGWQETGMRMCMATPPRRSDPLPTIAQRMARPCYWCDHGVLLSIRSTTLDADAFDRLAEPLRMQLREPAPAAPAISVPSPAASSQATSPGAHAQS
jgi:hypothetical protein